MSRSGFIARRVSSRDNRPRAVDACPGTRRAEYQMAEVSVAKLTDIADGDYRIFALDKIEVGIFRTGSKVLAYENVCPHAGGPVCQGKIFHQVEEVITPDKKSAGLRFGKQRHIVCP